MSSRKTVDVAIVGLGHLHPRLYMALFASLPETRVSAVVEADPALRDKFAADYRTQAFPTVAAMLKNARPDAAFVFLPHADCPAACETLAQSKVHLFVEKPMAASAAGAARIAQAARRAKVRLTTGYCWRLHPAAREIRNLVASGVLGEIVGGEGRIAAGRLQRYIDGHSPWMLDRKRSGGGPMYNLGVHWIDLFRWILNDEVAEVSGRNVQVNKNYNIEDNSFAHLSFRKGAIMALDISYTVPEAFPYGRDLYVSFRGTRGVVSWAPAYEGEKDIVFVVSDDPRFAGSPKRHLQFDLEPVKGYSGFMGRELVREFIRSIRSGGEPPVTGMDGVAALKVVEAVYKSAERKRWVEVPR